MKRNALLINTARGGLVDEAALIQALEQGLIAGAGFDVLTVEPPKNGHPLLDVRRPNFILTPHVAWASDGAMQFLADQLIDNIDAWASGKPQHLVTSGGLDTMLAAMMKKLLYQFDTDALPSVFDNVVGYDGGADHISAYGGVNAANVGGSGRRRNFYPLAQGQEEHGDFRRRRQHAGGRGGARGDPRKIFREISRLRDVRLQRLQHDGGGGGGVAGARPRTAGKRAVVLAGSGPVGQRAAALLAREGAHVAITGRKREVVQAACDSLKRASASRFGPSRRRPTPSAAPPRRRADRARNRRLRHHAAGEQRGRKTQRWN